MSEKKDIRKYSLAQLQEDFKSMGLQSFRAKQVYEWLWNKQAMDFEAMSNLSKDLRAQLHDLYNIYPTEISVVQKSTDGTIKMGFRLRDDRMIEGVIIPAEDRMTACVSSQVGCSLSCSFCATGFLKRERNLEAAEIFDQVVLLNRQAIAQYGRGLTNIVYMGMGEPLLNYDNVLRSIELINSEDGLFMSNKRITLSTSGVARGIMRLADEGRKFNLALSLHAATDEKRIQIMDINKSNPLDDVIDALNYFYEKTGNKITFEYILFNEFNDSMEDAIALHNLCKRVPAFVNLIEYNLVEGVPFTKSPEEKVVAFKHYLETNGISVQLRRSRGKDIDAACGQLANKN
jgi:23S rRNA (adenine2503-C2)-methyltransferase